MAVLRRFLLVLSLGAWGVLPAAALTGEELEAKLALIELPDGFSISVFADGLENSRSLAIGNRGTVFVGSRRSESVIALSDTDGDGKADATHVIYTLGDLDDGKERFMPNGVAFRDGALYVATVSTIMRFDDIENRLDDPPAPDVVTDDYPDNRHHGWKFIAFGPDDKLYVPIGTPCNVCDPEDRLFGVITRINPDGSNREIVARGIRNTLGFDWHPETGELWFTENGADKMGDDIPADELNVITGPGQHFGNPFFHEGDLADPNFGEGKNPDDYVRPTLKLGPHVAALGMRFYTGDQFPETYRHQIFIAEHGSGGRDELIGYRVMLVRVDGSDATSYEEFATGWIQDNEAWGRPVDIAIMADGSMLVSDDRAGAIYRITYDR